MSKLTVVIAVLGLTAAAARADQTEEAKKKLAEAKVEVCVKLQKYLTGPKITCTPETSTRMQQLHQACMGKISGKAKEAGQPKQEAKPAEGSAAKDSCRALDGDGKLIAELIDPSFVTCSKRIKEEVAKLRCQDGVKKVPYQFQREDRKPIGATAYCK
jgi:hypothetical protein